MAKDAVQHRADTNNRGARYAAMAVSIITAVTFGLALLAVPISGANCPGDCIGYPYLDTLDRYPRDYIWMYSAMVLLVAYVVFIIGLRRTLLSAGSILADVAVVLSGITAAVLIPTYFTQSAVVPASLAAGETDGITLLTQYNPHGLFIALEEIGYLLMSLSFVAMVPLIRGRDSLVRGIRWLFAAAFVIPVLALVAYSISYGLDRQDRFEVVLISANWLVLIVGGALVARLLGRRGVGSSG